MNSPFHHYGEAGPSSVFGQLRLLAMLSPRKDGPMMTKSDPVPKVPDLYNPLISALRTLGGSATVPEIEEQVAKDLRLTDEVLEIKAKSHPYKSEVMYRLAWARTYLKDFGVIDNSQRGVWTLTPKSQDLSSINATEVRKHHAALKANARKARALRSSADGEADGPPEEDSNTWKQLLISTILEKMSPSGFERLIQRVLRESGFTQVEVTGRSGDQGIDGRGIAKIHGFMSFHVVFQAKRYRGSVPVGAIRDFRGALVGRGDKGLFITTGVFTKDARAEASRDGATPIDLIDGEEFADKLKELGLGVATKVVEEVIVNDQWFETV
jgi:restriction system protein